MHWRVARSGWLAAPLALLVLMAIHPNRALAQRPVGIDVSDYQGTGINWTTVKNDGVTFAWTKATEGAPGQYVSQASFTINENGGKSAGVYMGAYHYCHAEQNVPSAEDSYFWSVAGSYILADGKTLMPMLDVEGKSLTTSIIGASTLSQWVNDWCTDIVSDAAKVGVSIRPTVYSSACSFAYMDTSIAQWVSDVADYNGEAAQTGTPWSTCASDNPWGGGNWNFWQYTDADPISGEGDGDVFNGTLSSLQNSMLAIVSTNSSIYYWDPQGTTGSNPYTGSMTGTWENADWSYGSTGLATPANWVEGKAACFGVHTGNGTPAYTVTLNASHVVAGFFDGALAPNSCNVTLTGSGIINLATGPQAFDAINASDGSQGILTINNTIAGDGQLVPEGNGQLYLNGTNSYSGGTALGYTGIPFYGTLNFNNGSAFGLGTITLQSVGTGGALALEGAAAVTVTNSVTVASATTNNFVGNTAGLTFSGPWSLGAYLNMGSGGSANSLITIAGPISGSGNFSKYNPGILALSGVNSYTGATTITAGTLKITGAGNLGSGSYSRLLTNNGTFIYNSSSSQTLSGVISGTGSLTEAGPGQLTLSGANTFSGKTTISGGLLVISSDANLGAAPGSFTANSITISSGTTTNNYGLRTSGSFSLNANRGITLSGGGQIQVAQGGTLSYNGIISGSGGLECGTSTTVGYGTLFLEGSNIYSGPTTIAAGTLELGINGALPSGTPLTIAAANSVGGTFNMNGKSQTIGSLSSSPGINGTGTNTPTIDLTGQLTILQSNNTTFSGLIAGSGGGLTLNGSGTLTLNGSNTYTGVTTVSAGTLALGSNSSINNTLAVSIAAGGTFDVSAISSYVFGGSTLLTARGTATPATIFGAPGGTVSPAQSIALDYDGSHPALTIAQGQLVLNGNAINVNGPVLPVGTYTIIQQASGSVAASGVFTVSGTAIGAGTTGTIAVSGGNVNLLVRTTAAFSNLTASTNIVYGAGSVTLSGTVSGAGPTYPAAGETVSVAINTNLQTTTVNDSTGDFSISYNAAGIPVSSNAYTITYSYGGDAALSPATDGSKTLTVNPLPANLIGTRPYDGTANAPASILSVSNKIGSDVVTAASGSGTLASPNAGTQPITSFGTLALGGAAAGNYTLTGATGSVIITAPPFSITSATLDSTGSNFVITWQSAPGATYQVLGTTNVLTPITWTNVGAPIVATNTITSATNPITSTTGFFNVTGH
ncbi:MAG TPA: autotransporter-associated beta strand repeat-containing protein [Verrucomicrobiae bacterium]|nr:autotransporter-associated beta strand repeat-containing protein [Verrucomicrobiae bacterium]